MKALAAALCFALALLSGPLAAQEDDGAGEIIVTGARRINGMPVVVEKPPVIGLRRTADSAVRTIEIVSDSRGSDLRKTEVRAMLLAAIDRAGRDGLTLVTGDYTVVEVTRANWQSQFPGLADKADAAEDEDDEDEEDEDDRPQPAFVDNGNITTLRLKVKTRLDGQITNAAQKIGRFVKAVPATGRSQMVQRGGLALTIINPEQYRDELYRRIATGAQQALGFYAPGYGLDITGLDRAVAWKQVGTADLFLYIPYSFSVKTGR